MRERVRTVAAILVIDTSLRHECPRLERGLDESPEAFADRVRDELLAAQRRVLS